MEPDDPQFLERKLSRGDLINYGAATVAGAALTSLVSPSAADAKPTEPLQKRRGGSIKVAFTDATKNDTLDPSNGRSIADYRMSAPIFDTLVTYDSDWVLHPSLAEDWSVNSDGTRWSFKIRRGVEFHSGKTLTSRDVAWTVRHTLDPKTGGGSFASLSALKPSGIRTPDARTITFTLNRPDFWIGRYFANGSLAIIEAGTTNWLEGSPGTGPFKNASWQPGQGVELVRNDNYWKSGRPYLDEITAVAIPEEATRAEGVLSGDIDYADQITIPLVARFNSSRIAKAVPNANMRPWAINLNASVKPYNDPRVREAIKLAFDRELAVKLILKGNGAVGNDFLVAKGDPWYSNATKPRPFDPERAKALLKKAGYEGWRDTGWTTPAFPYVGQTMQLMQQGWKQAGMRLELQPVSVDLYIQKWLKTQRVVPSPYGSTFPMTSLDLFVVSTGIVDTGVKDRRLDSLIVKFKQTKSLAAQRGVMADITRRFDTVSGVVVPYYFPEFFAHKKRLKGVAPWEAYAFDAAELYLA